LGEDVLPREPWVVDPAGWAAQRGAGTS
jgi:hypothetical protein